MALERWPSRSRNRTGVRMVLASVVTDDHLKLLLLNWNPDRLRVSDTLHCSVIHRALR